MRDLERTFRALADATRLRIIAILLYHEACVCDLQPVLGLRQPLLSRHVAYLRSAGLIRDRRVGTRIYCSLALEGELGRALREFLQTIIPHFGPFREDALRMKAHMERTGWMRRGVSDSAQSENRRSGKEGDNEDQGSSVQL